MAGPGDAGSSEGTTGVGCLVRLFWFFGGNAILIVSAGYISQHRGSLLSVWDAVFWGAAILLMAVRYLDITRLHGQTATGDPATIGHWRRYVVLLLAAASLAWLATHAWAHFQA